jgi:hypothetical protein
MRSATTLGHDDTTGSALARNLGVTWHTAWTAVETEATARLAPRERLAGLKTLGVDAAGVRCLAGSHVGHSAPTSPVLVRYADDLVALCHTRDQAERVKARLAEWLAQRVLAFNEDKTRIVPSAKASTSSGFTSADTRTAS